MGAKALQPGGGLRLRPCGGLAVWVGSAFVGAGGRAVSDATGSVGLVSVGGSGLAEGHWG